MNSEKKREAQVKLKRLNGLLELCNAATSALASLETGLREHEEEYPYADEIDEMFGRVDEIECEIAQGADDIEWALDQDGDRSREGN